MARWHVTGRSVLGAQHVRQNQPNQDALATRPAGPDAPFAVLAVADGHGGARYIRSQHGSRLAVEVAREVTAELFAGRPADPAAVAELVAVTWPRALADQWRVAVDAHLAEAPFADAELAALGATPTGPRDVQQLRLNPALAYGSTLLVAAVGDDLLAFAHIGDGDLRVVAADGRVTGPVADDPANFGGETSSLASGQAAHKFRTALLPPGTPPPALVVAVTDGYPDCFPDDGDPSGRFAAGLWNLIAKHGLGKIEGQLERWLASYTANGAGDDITVGLVCQLDLLDPPG